MRSWRLAPAVWTLLVEMNARWPNRDRRSDGGVGDLAHSTRTSDHNVDADGTVNAYDFDVDGIDVDLLRRACEAHPAVTYWIYNRELAHHSTGFTRRPYYGSNPHTAHFHVSFTHGPAENDTRPWGIAPRRPAPGPARPKPPEEIEMICMRRKANGAVIFVTGGVGVPVDDTDYDDFIAAGIKTLQLDEEGWKVTAEPLLEAGRNATRIDELLSKLDASVRANKPSPVVIPK